MEKRRPSREVQGRSPRVMQEEPQKWDIVETEGRKHFRKEVVHCIKSCWNFKEGERKLWLFDLVTWRQSVTFARTVSVELWGQKPDRVLTQCDKTLCISNNSVLQKIKWLNIFWAYFMCLTWIPPLPHFYGLYSSDDYPLTSPLSSLLQRDPTQASSTYLRGLF